MARCTIHKKKELANVKEDHDILNTPPPNDPSWVYSPSSLPGLPKDGSFANWNSISSVDRDLDLIKHMVTAPLISMMWTQLEKIYLIKISDGTFSKGDPEDDEYKQFRPCDGLGNWFTDTDIENSKFCFENTAYPYVSFHAADIPGYLGLKLLPLSDSCVRYNGVTTRSTRTFSTSRAWIVYKVTIRSLSRGTYFKVVFYTYKN